MMVVDLEGSGLISRSDLIAFTLVLALVLDLGLDLSDEEESGLDLSGAEAGAGAGEAVLAPPSIYQLRTWRMTSIKDQRPTFRLYFFSSPLSISWRARRTCAPTSSITPTPSPRPILLLPLSLLLLLLDCRLPRINNLAAQLRNGRIVGFAQPDEGITCFRSLSHELWASTTETNSWRPRSTRARRAVAWDERNERTHAQEIFSGYHFGVHLGQQLNRFLPSLALFLLITQACGGSCDDQRLGGITYIGLTLGKDVGHLLQRSNERVGVHFLVFGYFDSCSSSDVRADAQRNVAWGARVKTSRRAAVPSGLWKLLRMLGWSVCEGLEKGVQGREETLNWIAKSVCRNNRWFRFR